MKVEDYGNMLAQVQGVPCLSFVMFGSYQGEWVAILDRGDDLELWKGSYGSCSGCDWLEAEKDWSSGEVSDEKAREFFREDKPFAVIPKSTARDMTLEIFEQVLPANVRSDIYEFDPKEMFEALKKASI